MTRRDYVLLSNALASTRPDFLRQPMSWRVWDQTIRAVANAIAQNNSTFNTDRFLAACNAEAE